MQLLAKRIKAVTVAFSALTLTQFFVTAKMLQHDTFYLLAVTSAGAIILFAFLWNWYLLQKIREKTSELYIQSRFDPLTGLPNRLMFREKMDSLTGDRRNSFSVIFLDVDRFKMYNDTYGHDFGDTMLVEISKRISDNLRDDNSVYRLGGDEFVIVLESITNKGVISSIAERIKTQVSSSIVINGIEFFPSFSAGISRFPEDAEDSDGLLKRADIAMYKAKDSGKNMISFFDKTTHEQIKRTFEIQNGFRDARRDGSIKLAFQPQIDASTGKLHSVEVLSRWDHPKLGVISPVEFIPVLEETGEIIDLTEHIIEHVAFMRKAFSLDCKFSVNISAIHLKRRDRDVAKFLRDVMKRNSLSSDFIEFEFTESVIMENSRAMKERLKELSEMGVSMAIDDFGTGYSSLAYIQRFPITKIKIDKSFISEIGCSDTTLLNTIITMSESLGKITVAEGVETDIQRDYLLSRGCNICQGYLFSRPMDEKSFIEYIS